MGAVRAGAPGFFPLDRELGLAPGSPWSPHARQLLVRIGTEVPFGHGPGILALTTGLVVSASTIRAQTEAAGARLVVVEAAERDRIERTMPDAPPGADRQQVSVDGAMVPVLGGTWREVRTLVVGALGQGGGETRETGPWRYFSRMVDAEQVSRGAIPELHWCGTEHASVVAAVADGAPWCQGFFDDHVPTATRILDYPHAMEHLSAVALEVFGSGTEAATAWITTHGEELRTGDPAVVLAAIAALPVAAAPHPTEASASRDRELAYFTARRNQIDYAGFVAAGLPIGSGAVESANKLVVEARLNGAGMHWREANVDPMLALRCALKSGRWAERWNAQSTWMPIPPASPAPASRTSPRDPSPAPAPTCHSPSTTTRPKTIVNGRPTPDHPWKRGLQPHPRPSPPSP